MRLWEQYRPSRYEDVVGQDRALKALERLRKRGLGGRAFWLTGKSGTGKTSIARLIATECGSTMPGSIVEMDGSDLTLTELERIQERERYYPMGGGRAYIINEAHALPDRVIARLLTLLEPIRKHTVWLFTTTAKAQSELFDDAGPLMSRCTVLPLETQGLTPKFAAHAKQIAGAEGLDGKPLSAYVRLLNDCSQNMRAALDRVEQGQMLQGG